MTPQEINEAVAKKLGTISRMPVKNEETGEYLRCWPDYSTSIEAAWEIVEKVRVTELFALCFHDGQRHCEINCCDGDRPIDEESDIPAMAICLAFLKLEG